MSVLPWARILVICTFPTTRDARGRGKCPSSGAGEQEDRGASTRDYSLVCLESEQITSTASSLEIPRFRSYVKTSTLSLRYCNLVCCGDLKQATIMDARTLADLRILA